jgi:hypothetical protein
LDLVKSTPTRGGRRRIGWASRGRPCLRISRCRRTVPVRRLVVFSSHAYSCRWAALAARRRERRSAHLLLRGLHAVWHRGRASTAHMDVEIWRACRDNTATVVLRPPGCDAAEDGLHIANRAQMRCRRSGQCGTKRTEQHGYTAEALLTAPPV